MRAGSEPFLLDLGLDSRSPLPLYYQLREMLRERLEEGRLGPGERFPTETEICRATGLSRMTVRQALGELKTEGLIIGKRGAGTVVASPARRQLLGPERGLKDGHGVLRSFTETFRAQGQRVGGKVLARTMVAAPAATQRELGLSSPEPVLEIRRVRYLDGEPVLLETSHYPNPVAGLLAEADLDDRSVYEVWEKAGVFPEEAVETVELSVITAYESRTLHAPAGTPVALCRRTTYDRAGRPIEFTKVVYRGDKHRFTVRLRRQDLRPGR